MWKKLYDSGYFEDYGTTTADTQTAFFSGQVGMIIESTAILKNAVDSSPFEVGTGYLPRIEQNDEGGVIIGGGSLWLTDTGNEANEDAASIVDRAEEDVIRMKRVALEDMKDDITDIAVQIAQKVIGDAIPKAQLVESATVHTNEAIEAEVRKSE